MWTVDGLTDRTDRFDSIFKTRDKKIAEIGRFFGEISDFGGAGKDFGVEKSDGKKSGENRDKSAIFRKRADFCRFFGPCCTRAEEARPSRHYRR